MRGKVGGLSPPYFKSRGAIAPLAPLLPPPLVLVKGKYSRFYHQRRMASVQSRFESNGLLDLVDFGDKCLC